MDNPIDRIVARIHNRKGVTVHDEVVLKAINLRVEVPNEEVARALIERLDNPSRKPKDRWFYIALHRHGAPMRGRPRKVVAKPVKRTGLGNGKGVLLPDDLQRNLWKKGVSGNPRGRPRGAKDRYKRKTNGSPHLKKYHFKKGVARNPKGTPDWKVRRERNLSEFKSENFMKYLEAKARGLNPYPAFDYRTGLFKIANPKEFRVYAIVISIVQNTEGNPNARKFSLLQQIFFKSLLRLP